MDTIALHLLDETALADLSEAPDRYAANHAFKLGPHAELVQAVARQTLAFIRQNRITPPWGAYLTVEPAELLVVGTCSFKGPPDERREVELAYFTLPGHEGRGYATAMASALRDIAAASRDVHIVRAHTLPERNASVRILEKLGFKWGGDVQDPEDGLVWRWEWQAPEQQD